MSKVNRKATTAAAEKIAATASKEADENRNPLKPEQEEEAIGKKRRGRPAANKEVDEVAAPDVEVPVRKQLKSRLESTENLGELTNI
jgi:hypothetical protein